MTSLTIQVDRHSSAHFELEPDGRIFASSNGDGEYMDPVEVFMEICRLLAVEPTPVLPADTDPPTTVQEDKDARPCEHDDCSNLLPSDAPDDVVYCGRRDCSINTDPSTTLGGA